MSGDSAALASERLHSLLLADDPELRDIVEEFVETLDRRIDEIRQAYAQLDWAALRTLAHRLKGAGGSYGYPPLSSLAAEMEKNFAAHNAGAFQDWLRELEQLTTAAKAGLHSHP